MSGRGSPSPAIGPPAAAVRTGPEGRQVQVCQAGTHPQLPGWTRRSADSCTACRTEASLAAAITVLAAVLPRADDETGDARAEREGTWGGRPAPAVQAGAALLAVVEGGSPSYAGMRFRRITAHLDAHPDALVAGGTNVPVDVARLISVLHDQGYPGVVHPHCADCGRECFPRANRGDGQRICRRCDVRRRHTACGRCGRVRPVHHRDPEGAPVCEPCHRLDPAGWQPCGLCRQPATIRMTLNGVKIGDCCYLKPHERCSVCGVGRAVGVYASGKATCTACSTAPHAVCSRCTLDAPAPGPDGPAVCLRCRTGANLPCGVCGTVTVSRDAAGRPQCSTCLTRRPRRCGRCGRVSVIARRATDATPDLCNPCWRGPVTACARCGRVRPCRGARAGRMLCRGCTPRRRRTCGYCGHHRKVAAVWQDGPACNSCYRRFMRAKGDCPGCGTHRRLLPYPGHRQPVCASCAGAPPGPVCGRCGNEDWLYRAGMCARCVLADRLHDLLGDLERRGDLGLQALYEALTGAESPESVLGWTRPRAPGTAHKLLRGLGRGEIALTHEALDALNTPGNGGSANHLNAILTAIGSLPERDLPLARLERAVPVVLAAVTDPARLALLTKYATWDVLRRARTSSRRGTLTAAAGHAAVRRLTTAGHFLAWLAQAGLDLPGAGQSDLDDYLLAHPGRRADLPRFLTWAHRSRRTPTALHVPTTPSTPPSVAAADDTDRWHLARKLLHDDGYTPADRVAGLLVLLFAQRPHQISALTTGHITTTPGGQVRIALGPKLIEVPSPLAEHLQDLVTARRTPASVHPLPPGIWLFPNTHPGRPANPETITHRLQRLGIQPAAHRAAALLHLAAELPPALLKDLLGLGDTTTQTWAALAGRTWATYIGDRLNDDDRATT